ncbi:hypothetical protein [Bdellovibrio svalbardensis]|uniref:Uncharacterized protein n=1 Tax=Bdellovibrio svalbardensis TaxID=2972972 RepID=A0ABT6DJC0_9BACT|nr:hypothetical protein [Bdellovibrio svalbardensis]MDG0815956.1 hypothetical protein [Bdellovibrio svalbardensis]
MKNSIILLFLYFTFSSILVQAALSSDFKDQSSFNEVWQVVQDTTQNSLIDDSERSIKNSYSKNHFPTYEINFSRFFSVTKSGIHDKLSAATFRTLHDHRDYYPRIDKLLHSNGICFSGTWNITHSTEYSGLFANNTAIPLIARASTTLSGVRRGEKRGAALALKLFPTTTNDTATLTQNIFAIDMLAGRHIRHFTDVSMTNEPDFGLSLNLPLGLHVLKSFLKADQNPGFRPIDHLAQFDAQGRQEFLVRSPKWIKFEPHYSNKTSDHADFREELFESASDQPLRYDILVKSAKADFNDKKSWQRVGYILLSQPTISYGCDRQLHFPHPRINP